MTSKTLFLKVFGDTPILRVMDFLVVNEDFDYGMTDIARHASVGYATLKLFWENLEENGVVINTRNVGKAKMYRLNPANPAVKKFREFYWETTKQQLRGSLQKKTAVKVMH